MTTTRRIPILLEAVGLGPDKAGREKLKQARVFARSCRRVAMSLLGKMILSCVMCGAIGEVSAQKNWLVPLRPAPTHQSVPPKPTPSPPKPQEAVPSSENEIKGAFGFTLGERVDPRFKLYHDSHEKDLPYYRIHPELKLTEKMSIEYRVLLTHGDRRVALIHAKCILASFHDVQSFLHRVQELILSKYGSGRQHIQSTPFGHKWFYTKPKHPTVTISIETDSTTGIVSIQYANETLVSEIRRDVWEKRVGQLNLSAL